MTMKNLTFFLMLFFVLWQPCFISAQAKEPSSGKESPIKWYSFEEAYKKNKKNPKKIFIDVFTDWCGWCKKMDAETFTDPTIAKYMNKHFYCVKFDAERKDTIVLDGQVFVNPNPTGKRSTHKLAFDLLGGNLSYPSYVFLNENGQKLSVVGGYQKAKDFEGVLHYFGDNAYLKSTWEDYRPTFKGEVK